MNNLFSVKCFSLLLVVIFLVSFLSCSISPTEKNISETTSALSENTQPEVTDLTPYLPKETFGGYELKVLNIDPELNWCLSAIVVDKENGEIINDTIVQRNRTIEEKYEIKFIYYPNVGYSDMSALIKRSNMAGDYLYDIAFPILRDAGTLALDNQLQDIKHVPYIDTDQSWWTKNATEQLSIKDKLFFTTNDICIGNIENCWSIEFNKKLITEYGLDNPYELVTSGNWIMDKFLSMSKAVAQDVNGDGDMKSLENNFGFVSLLHNGTYLAFLTSGDEYTIKKDENDYPLLVMDNERFYSVYQKILDVLNNSNVGANANQPWMNYDKGKEYLFTNDQALFLIDLLHYGRRLRSMKADFGIIPLPKYDESQENYYTATTYGCPVFVIPITNTDLERTGVIVEALAAESSKTLIPAYINVALEGKYLRDEESMPMVELILDSRAYDLSNAYNWNNLGNIINDAMISNNSNIASLYAKHSEKTKNAIEKSINNFID
jgi:hypothetical protein